jgi:hypothetical protein
MASRDVFSTNEAHSLLSPEELKLILTRWAVENEHHFKDPAYHANFDGKASNSRIAVRFVLHGATSVHPRESDGVADGEDESEQ